MKLRRVIRWFKKHLKVSYKDDLLLDDYWKERHDPCIKKVGKSVLQKGSLE